MPINLVRVPKDRDAWVIVNTYVEACWTDYVPGTGHCVVEFDTELEARIYVELERLADADEGLVLDDDESAVMRKAQAVIEYGEEVFGG